MTFPFWRPNAVEPERTAWDIVYLDNYDLPGVCTCAITPARGIKNVHEKGKDGVTQKDSGYEGAKVEITCTIWKQDQLDALYNLTPVFHPRKPGGTSGPITLDHPSAWFFGVTGIRVTKLHIPKPTGGLMVLQISAVEWFAAVKDSKNRGGTGGFPPDTDGGNWDVPDQPPPDPAGPGTNFP